MVERIRAALQETGRHIDEDHYGVVLPYRIGDPDHPEVVRFQRLLSQRRGEPGSPTPPGPAAVGDAAAVVETFRRYVDVGICKFVAVPLAGGPDDLHIQTERLAEEIGPRIEDR